MKAITQNDLRFPSRRKDARKGENGKVLIIGGSPDYPGAAALAGLAALRSGCDLVRVAAPEKVAWAVNCLSPDLITVKMKGERLGRIHVRKLLALSADVDAVLLGNGLGPCPWVRGFIKRCKHPLVIDADALKEMRFSDANGAILTPHRKEFEMLCRNSGIPPSLDEVQRHLRGNVLLLKGPEDIIMTSTARYVNRTGNDRMAVGGTGDVLAGLCAGFLGQGLTALQAALLGAYINGKTGDDLLLKKGYSFLASDLAKDSARVIKEARKHTLTS